MITECENAPDIDAAAKMGHISSKSAGAAESQTDSFEESPYLGPSGLHLGLQNPSISVSQGLCQLQVKLSTKDFSSYSRVPNKIGGKLMYSFSDVFPFHMALFRTSCVY